MRSFWNRLPKYLNSSMGSKTQHLTINLPSSYNAAISLCPMFRWTLEFDLPNSPTKKGANCSTFLTPSIFIMNTLTSTTSIAMGKNPPVGGFDQEKWGCSMAMLVYQRVFILLLMSLRVMALVQPSHPRGHPFHAACRDPWDLCPGWNAVMPTMPRGDAHDA